MSTANPSGIHVRLQYGAYLLFEYPPQTPSFLSKCCDLSLAFGRCVFHPCPRRVKTAMGQLKAKVSLNIDSSTDSTNISIPSHRALRDIPRLTPGKSVEHISPDSDECSTPGTPGSGFENKVLQGSVRPVSPH